MKIVIAGGSGFLGQALIARLLPEQHQIVVLGRSDRGSHGGGGSQPRYVKWSADGTAAGNWVREIDEADAIINLAGAGLADNRWSPERKAVLRSSRVESTRSLVAALNSAAARPRVFLQGSAVGYYGADLEDATKDESSPPGTDFLGKMSLAWEGAAAPAAGPGCRLVTLRTGVVLAAEAGALPQMALPFRLFGGGPVSSGRQVLSWIDRDDWTSMVLWLLSTPGAHGPFNAAAPEPVTNEEFSSALGRALRRPSWMRVPAFALRLALGEMAGPLLLSGQRVVPRRALALGFTFRYPTLADSLAHIFAR